MSQKCRKRKSCFKQPGKRNSFGVAGRVSLSFLGVFFCIWPQIPPPLQFYHASHAQKATVHFDQILTHYYESDWGILIHRGIVPNLTHMTWCASC
jgi:hypothetical protein